MRLEGKVAIISGGAGGMGAEEARLFAREGATVVIGDVLEEDGRQLEAELNETGAEALFLHLDVTVEEEWQKVIDTTVSRYGRLDCARVWEQMCQSRPIVDQSLGDQSHVFDRDSGRPDDPTCRRWSPWQQHVYD